MPDPARAAIEICELAARLDRLERENRRYKLAAAGAGLLCLAWAACSVGPQAKNSLSAERFVLMAPDGSEKATLELDSKGNPLLQMRNGSASAFLTTNGPSLLLRGQDGKTGAFIGIDSRDSSKLELNSRRVLDGVRISAHQDGSSGVYVHDVDGRPRGSLESFGTGGSGLSFRDGQGRMRAQLGLDPTHLANLILMDELGARRIGMIVQQDGNGLLEMSDEQGRARVQLATQFDGSPRLEMKQADGTPSFQAP